MIYMSLKDLKYVGVLSKSILVGDKVTNLVKSRITKYINNVNENEGCLSHNITSCSRLLFFYPLCSLYYCL